jgi:hypothetical protein
LALSPTFSSTISSSFHLLSGIYTLGISTNTVIENNVCHDIVAWGYGGWGLYADQASSGILLQNNVVYRTKSAGFHQHFGMNNT